MSHGGEKCTALPLREVPLADMQQPFIDRSDNGETTGTGGRV